MHGKGTCIVVLALFSSLFLAISSLSTLPQEAYKGVEHIQSAVAKRRRLRVEGGVANSQTIFRSSLRSSLLFAFSSLSSTKLLLAQCLVLCDWGLLA